jgi:hypothetical protein
MQVPFSYFKEKKKRISQRITELFQRFVKKVNHI